MKNIKKIKEKVSKVDEPLLGDVVAYIIKNQKVSTAAIQRNFSIGYPRAARLVDLMEEIGIISSISSEKSREIFINGEDYENIFERPFETRQYEIDREYRQVLDANNKAVEEELKNNDIKEKIFIKVSVDKLFKEALLLAINHKRISATILRRNFNIGYPRAARIIDQMFQYGFISDAKDIDGRDVLITIDEYNDMFGIK